MKTVASQNGQLGNVGHNESRNQTTMREKEKESDSMLCLQLN
jgi:hypothetical protein